jgi:undecaprenyl diphosphate synthase
MHIAIIMDGNGRWATRRHLPRTAGHRAGAKTVNVIVEAAARRGVDILSLYAFSSANWQRPKSEVSALFALLRRYLLSETQRCLDQSIRLNLVGRRDRLSPNLVELIERCEAATARCSGMLLRIAVDYSAQHSLIQTCRHLRAEDDIDRSRFGEYLAAVDHSAAPAPEVDLLIRTGGEKRLSDFLLWECAYAELLFLDSLWPDFDQAAFAEALNVFALRDRRYGRIGWQRAAKWGRA